MGSIHEKNKCKKSRDTASVTLTRVALEENLQLLFKTILHHDALSEIFLKKSNMGHKLYDLSF